MSHGLWRPDSGGRPPVAHCQRARPQQSPCRIPSLTENINSSIPGGRLGFHQPPAHVRTRRTAATSPVRQRGAGLIGPDSRLNRKLIRHRPTNERFRDALPLTKWQGVLLYTRLRQHSPEAGTEGLRAVRELAAIVVVCTKAVEGVVDVLAGSQRIQAASSSAWGYRGAYEGGYDYEEDEP
jgi:hypothetical protein